MAMNNFGAGFTLRAYDQATTTVRNVSNSLSEMFSKGKQGVDLLNQSMARRDVGAKMKQIGMGILDSIGKMGDSAAAVNKTIQGIVAIRGESEKTGEAMRAQLRGAQFAELGFTADQAAGALQSLTLGGNSVKDSMGVMDAAMRFARIGMMDASQAGSTLDAMFDIFGGTLGDSTDRVDKMAWSMRQFGLGGQQLSTLMQYTASSAQLVNASFDDMLMATSMVGTVIPQTEKAASAVNMAFQQLANEQVQKKLKKLHVEVADGQGKFKGLSAILVDLMKGMESMDEAARATALKDVFGSRSAGGMMTIIKQLESGVKGLNGEMLYGGDAAAYLAEQMGKSTGMAQEMADGMTTAREKMAAASDRMRKTMGDSADLMMDPVREAVAKIFNRISDVLGALPPEFKKTFLIAGTALGGFLAITGSVIVFTTVLNQMGMSVTMFGLKILKTALIIAPFALAIGGLGVAFYAAFKAMSKAGGPMAGLMDKLRLGWKAMMELISTGSLSKATQKALGDPKNSGVAKFVTWFEGLLARWGKFWDGLKAGWEEGVALLGPQIDAFVAKLGEVMAVFDTGDPAGKMDEWGEAGKGAGGMLAQLGGVGIQLMTALLDLLPPIVEYFKGITAKDISNGIITLIDGFKMMVNVVTVVARAIGGLWNLIQFIGARIGELFALWIDSFVTLGQTLDDIASGNFGAAFTRVKNFAGRAWDALTGTGGEQATQFNEMLSSLSGGEYGGTSEADKQLVVARGRNERVTELVGQYRDLEKTAGTEEQLNKRLLAQKGDKDALRRDAAVLRELVGMREAINKLAGKDLVARVETATIARAATTGAEHEAGRSLAPLPAI